MSIGEISAAQVDGRYIGADGEMVWVTLNATVMPDPEGRPLFLFAQIQDVSEREHAEHTLEKQREFLSTVLESLEAKRRALALGASDFVTKPFDELEMMLRVKNLLEARHLQIRLAEYNATLELQASERTAEIERTRLEILDRLALTAEYRDDATFEHARRVGRTAALLAHRLDAPQPLVERIGRAVILHDIGKIGVPDSILLKPGPLTTEEFEAMKSHTTIGAQVLSGSRSSLLKLAEQIAASHHERWDGRGYPHALQGEQIPLCGRIVAVADVYDVLAHERPYKPAWSLEESLREVRDQSGSHFDPRVVEAFDRLDHGALLAPMDDALQRGRVLEAAAL